jgi:hypothetical protein
MASGGDPTAIRQQQITVTPCGEQVVINWLQSAHIPADYGRLIIASLATADVRMTTGSDSDAPVWGMALSVTARAVNILA